MTARATRSAKPGSIAALVGAAALVVALATPASAQEATPDPLGPSTADVALCWGLLGGGGGGAMLAAYNWRGGDPDRPTSTPPPDLVSRPNLLIAGTGAIAVSVWQCKRVGESGAAPVWSWHRAASGSVGEPGLCDSVRSAARFA